MIDMFDTETDRPERIGIIGGSGLYALLGEADHDRAATPYGKASDAVALGELAGRLVAFLPRHGAEHQFPPHQINYRANLWALRRVGVTRIIGVSAVGSLSASLEPGSLVVPDQLVDRTAGRAATFFEHPHTAHAPFADPYCAPGRADVLAAAADWPAIDGGTQVVIEGPRFSTRAESRWYAAQGWTLVGMTALPEVALARELGMCYLPLCLVTDLDAGVEVGGGVTQEEVMARFAVNLERIRRLVGELVAELPPDRSCDCAELAPSPM